MSVFHNLTPFIFTKINSTNLILGVNEFLRNSQGILWSKMWNLKLYFESSGGQPVCSAPALQHSSPLHSSYFSKPSMPPVQCSHFFERAKFYKKTGEKRALFQQKNGQKTGEIKKCHEKKRALSSYHLCQPDFQNLWRTLFCIIGHTLI